MGKKNPIKEVIKGASDLAVAPIRETARTIGADGVVNFMDGVKNTSNAIGIGAVDLANNEKGKQQKKADEANRQVEAANRSAAETTAKQQAAAESDRIESERMSAGSKSRTLLTGPAGLEDEEGVTISRRTLQARR